MSSYGDDQEEIMASLDGLSKMMPGLERLDKIEFFGVALSTYIAFGLFPMGAILFLYFAFIAESHSYWNLLFIELSSGFAFFAVAPTIIRLGRKYRKLVPFCGLLAAAILLIVAHNPEEVFSSFSLHLLEFIQAVLIEYSIALVLIVGLEVAMSPWLNVLAEKYRQLQPRT